MTAIAELAEGPIGIVPEPVLKDSIVRELVPSRRPNASPEKIGAARELLAGLEAEMVQVNLQELTELRRYHPELADKQVFAMWSDVRNDHTDWGDLTAEAVRLSFEIKDVKAWLRWATGRSRRINPGAIDDSASAMHLAKEAGSLIRCATEAGAIHFANELRQLIHAVTVRHPSLMTRGIGQRDRGRSARRSTAVRTRGSRRSGTGTSSSSSDPGDGGDSDPPGSRAQTRGEIEKSPRYCRGCGLALRGYAPQARFHSPAHRKWWLDNGKVDAEPVVGIEYGPGTKTRAEIRAAIAKQRVTDNPGLLLDDPEMLAQAGVVMVSPETVGADFFEQLAKWKLELTTEEIPAKINFVRRELYEEAFVRRPRRLGRARQGDCELLLERHSQIRKWYRTRIAALESLRGKTSHGFKWSKPDANPGGTDGDVFRLHLRPLETGRLAA